MNPTTRVFLLFALFASGYCALLVAFGPAGLRYPDAMEYADMARGIARGDGLLDRSVWIYQLSFTPDVPSPSIRRAPLFPVMQSVAFWLFGPSDLVAHGTSAFCFLLAALMLFALATYVSPLEKHAWLVGLSAATLFLFDAQSLFYSVSGLSEPLFTLAVLGIAFLLASPPIRGQWFLIGLLAGASHWIRLNGFMLVLPCLIASFARDRKTFLQSLLPILSGTAIPIVLIAFRNWQAIGSFSPTGINGAIIFNELGGLTEHGIERKLYLPPDSPPNLLWAFQHHLADFAAKVTRGLDKNLIAALAAVSPVVSGAVALHAAAGWNTMEPRVRALSAFTLSTLGLWLLMFSLGEFEGSRFYVPLSPLMILLAVLAFVEIGRGNRAGRREIIVGAAALITLSGLPGLLRLPGLQRNDNGVEHRRYLREAIQRATPPGSVIMTDSPETVAWYGDRTALWIPRSPAETARIAERAKATHLVLTQFAARNRELDPAWGDIFMRRSPPPFKAQPLSAGPLERNLMILQLSR